MLFAGLWLVGGALLFGNIQDELIPRTDRGYVIGFTQGPEGSTIEYMDPYQVQAEKIMMETPEVGRMFSVIALGIGAPGIVNKGLIFASLNDDRTRTQAEIAKDVGKRFESIAGIEAKAFEPSPLRGVSSAAAVDIRIQGPDLQVLSDVGHALEDRIGELPGYGNTDVDIYLSKPQFDVAIDRDRANDLGLSIREISRTLQVLLGGEALATFKLGGETYDVVAQLGRGERNDPRDLLELSVRGASGQLVSLSSVVTVEETIAPREIQHYDRQRNVRFTVKPEGVSQGEAIETVLALARELAPDDGGYQVRVSGESEAFYESGNALAFAYGLALLIVYLVLAAQFESFVHPITILVAVALSFTGALAALWLTDTTLNIYSKIGLVMLVGLVTKNGILIVEFANQLRERGESLVDAAVEAAQTRFRPILMTALATMVGILPIALGRGAGGDARAPLGVAVVGGMFFSTALTFFIVPATYVVIERIRARLTQRGAGEAAAVPVAGGR